MGNSSSARDSDPKPTDKAVTRPPNFDQFVAVVSRVRGYENTVRYPDDIVYHCLRGSPIDQVIACLDRSVMRLLPKVQTTTLADAMEVAVVCGHFDIVRVLLRYGASAQHYGIACDYHHRLNAANIAQMDGKTNDFKHSLASFASSSSSSPATPAPGIPASAIRSEALSRCQMGQVSRSAIHFADHQAWAASNFNAGFKPRPESRTTPLFDAVRHNHMAIVMLLLQQCQTSVALATLRPTIRHRQWRSSTQRNDWYSRRTSGDSHIPHDTMIPSPMAALCYHSGNVEMMIYLLKQDPLAIQWLANTDVTIRSFCSLETCYDNPPTRHVLVAQGTHIPPLDDHRDTSLRRSFPAWLTMERQLTDWSQPPVSYSADEFNDFGPLHLATLGMHANLVEWLCQQLDSDTLPINVDMLTPPTAAQVSASLSVSPSTVSSSPSTRTSKVGNGRSTSCLSTCVNDVAVDQIGWSFEGRWGHRQRLDKSVTPLRMALCIAWDTAKPRSLGIERHVYYHHLRGNQSQWTFARDQIIRVITCLVSYGAAFDSHDIDMDTTSIVEIIQQWMMGTSIQPMTNIPPVSDWQWIDVAIKNGRLLWKQRQHTRLQLLVDAGVRPIQVAAIVHSYLYR